jgi:hypothetical protein
MRALNKEAEQKLITAIERAASLVNSGSTPNDAIIKSASDANVPAGHINLMVHAYNTGRTTKQREQGENTFEKSADFQLANADVVMEALYPKQVKTSSAIEQSGIVSTEYAVSPVGFLSRRKAEMNKAASAQVALPVKTWVPAPRDEQAAVERAYSQKVAEKRAAEEVRRVASAAYQKAAASMEKLCEYFRVPGNMSFGDAVREVSLRLGNDGEMVLNKVAAVYPHVTKQAATREMYIGNLVPCQLVEDVLNAVEDYNTAQKAANDIKTASAPIKKEVPEFLTGSILYNPADEPLTLKEASSGPPRPPRPTPPEKPTTLADRFFRPVTTAAKHMTAAQKKPSGLSSLMFDAPQSSNEVIKDQYNKLTDPEHETALRGVRAQGALHDLMLNDPVISGHDPYDVAMAYNEISDAAPSLGDSPALLQAMMRKRLQAGEMGDFDVKQLLEMDKLRADRDAAVLNNRKTEQEILPGFLGK